MPSSTSHNHIALKDNQMHRHLKLSIFHHQKSSGQSAVGLSIIMSILQTCEVVAAVSPLPFLAPAFTAIIKLIKSIQNADSNHHSSIDILKKTSNYNDALKEYANCPNYDTVSKLVQKHTEDFARSLEQVNERINAVESHGTLYNIFQSSESKASLEKITRELDTAKNLLFFQLTQAMMKEIDTLHKERSFPQDPAPSPHPAKDPHTFFPNPKFPPPKDSTLHTKFPYSSQAKNIAVNDFNTKSADYMLMPVPHINGLACSNYTFGIVEMPTPEPYYSYIPQPIY
ncbi:hypothetical protein Clacol_000714 [Clathrus columnatus]|uniref:Uncharacterized protein n=1 Tax=Clathrus columnatus TaxID=1419009 RepID=A0AAV4ZZE5_9AGAM|nr:hypothetical protein Clacol_000714 [Clathrus columnatus]